MDRPEIKDLYKILETSHEGFVSIYKAIDISAKAEVQIKELQDPDPSGLIWFLKEIDAWKSLNQDPAPPRVPKFVMSADGGKQFVLQFIPGMTAEKHYKNKPLIDGAEVVKFLILCLETLAVIHQKGLIHRDLKPSKLIIHQETLEPWLVDFVVARPPRLKLKELTNTTHFVASSAYMAPERHSGLVSHVTDIFGLGATLLALTNRTSDDDATWSDVIARCPWNQELKNVLLKMVEEDPEKRYQNCSDIIAALKAVPVSVVDPQTQHTYHKKKEPLKIGDTVLGYKILAQCGKGGFGSVWKAVDTRDKRILVALKEVVDKEGTNWFEREITAHSKATRSPCAPRVPKFMFTQLKQSRFIMEFVPGDTADVHFDNHPMSVDVAIQFLLLILETLVAIHNRGLVHRDLKPGNIIIHSQTFEPWIVDFGIAKNVQVTPRGKGITDVGTVQFRAPESGHKLGRYTDIFSLGRTLLFLGADLSRVNSWDDDVLATCPPSWTNDFKDIVAKMIEQDYTRRYQRCEAVISDLKQLDRFTGERIVRGGGCTLL